MKTRIAVLALIASFSAWGVMAQDRSSRTTPSQKTQSQPASGDHQPPPQAYEDCRGKKAGDTVQHTTPEGTVAATCRDSPQGLVARPKQPKGDQSGNPSGDRSMPKSSLRGPQSRETPQRHSIEQAVSDQAQLHTIAFNGEMFSWYAGSLEADTYFCPERHGMYFGGFGMKTAPAMGKQDYAISTSLTSDSGAAFLSTLTDAQRKRITNLVDLQRQELVEIVKTRRAIATELRRFLRGESADQGKVMSLSKRYGELDGELSYLYATAHAEVGKTLTRQQKETLVRMRVYNPSDPKGPFLYSSPINLPKIGNTDFLFGVRRSSL
jgi:Spy/CpxP family protein refolding chaperone